MPEYRNVKARVDWQDYAGDEIILPICVRSPNVQGRNFTAMLESMVARDIRKVHVVLCDYLDRHNLNGDGDLALSQSLEWQKTYMKEVIALFPDVEMTTWLEILNHPTFHERHKTLYDLYLNNRTVHYAIDKNVDCYVRPKVRRLVEEIGWEYDLGKLTEDSTRYLLEEYAGTAIYKNFVNTQTQVYWGIYIQDTEVFNRHSPEVDLKLPITLPVTNNRLGASIASIQTPIRKTA